MRELNILEPRIWCKATDHIPEQIRLVQTLIDKGYTYTTSDGIYCDTTKISDYGKLAQLQKQELKAGVRIDIGEKRNPHDFALWKFTPAGEKRHMEWPFGFDAQGKEQMGFPGWHIECSAMSMKYLGEQFDIHCGGIDHVPVHHTNEIAQSESATGKIPWVNVWMHGEFLNIQDENASTAASATSADRQRKMAKSEGNFITLQTLKDKGFSPLAYRYFLLQTHYRKQLNFSWEALEAAQNGYEKLKNQIADLGDSFKLLPKTIAKYSEDFQKKINDDLNTPQALALIHEVLKDDSHSQDKWKTILDFDRILGLGLSSIHRRGKLEYTLQLQNFEANTPGLLNLLDKR
ncbi:MAG: DALR domain-containing protein, partial [Patescibacteria group bacterium]